MKKKDLLLMVVVLLLFSSCGDEPSALSIRTVYTVSQEVVLDTFLCTGDNIKWYNGTTGELKFKNMPRVEFGFPPRHIHYLIVLLGDIELIRFATVPSISSNSCLYACITEEPHKLYIRECYPFCDWAPGKRPEGTEWEGWGTVIVDENWKAIEPEWNIFIKQLKKEGRYRE